MTRMDMHVKPENMCREHLLGNHNECHQLVGYAKAGNINKLIGHSLRGQIDMTRLNEWHEQIAQEMKNRGFNHNSPLEWNFILPIGEGMITVSSTNKLTERCNECNHD